MKFETLGDLVVFRKVSIHISATAEMKFFFSQNNERD